MLVIGIDSGTQSTKAVVLDSESGVIVASGQQTYGFIAGLPRGHMEQDPQTWLDAVDASVRQCLSALGERRKEITALGVSGQQHGLVALDRKNRPVRPAKLWCDTSTTAQCEAFAREFGGADDLIALAGNPILPGYTAPKLLWLKQNEPGNFKSVDCVLLPHDYINFWLTGEKRMEYGDASGTGFMNVRERKWCEPLVDFIDPGLMERLPALGSSRKACGLLRDSLRTEWGLSGSPVVSSGGGDNMMGAIGTGNTRPGAATVSLGTSGTLYACSDEPVIDPAGEVAAFCDSNDRWLPLVCTMNVTVATEQVRLMFGWSVADLEQAVAKVSPGAGGVLFLPYLRGERTPNLPNGSAAFHGLNTGNLDAGHLARAVMEGATLGLAYGLNRFRGLGIEPREIRLTGGGSKSAVWRQMCADTFGIPTVCLESAEGAALGAAVQAAATHVSVSGGTGSVHSAAERLVKVDESTRAEPDADCVALYAELTKRQTDLTRRLHSAGYL